MDEMLSRFKTPFISNVYRESLMQSVWRRRSVVDNYNVLIAF